VKVIHQITKVFKKMLHFLIILLFSKKTKIKKKLIIPLGKAARQPQHYRKVAFLAHLGNLMGHNNTLENLGENYFKTSC